MRVFHLIMLLGALFTACTSTQQNSGGDIVEATGTITYVELEGGFYGIVTEDGLRFDPKNLEESFKEDGLQVRFRARTVEEAATIHMWGTLVEIISIERV